MSGLLNPFIKNRKHLVSSLTSLSASNDVSMHFQGHLEERRSRFLNYMMNVGVVANRVKNRSGFYQS